VTVYQVQMVRHEHVRVDGQTVALTIAFQTFEIGTVIRIVMKDRRAAIAARNHVVARTGDIEPGLASHGREGMGHRHNKSILGLTPIQVQRCVASGGTTDQ